LIQVTGHRGARDLAPENTLAGFRLAHELGCDAVELDVQLTRDGRLAVIHDETLERTTNGHGLVSDCTLEELKRLDAGSGERIPSLEEVFDLLADSGMRIQIELKGAGTEEPVAELVRGRGLLDRVAFTSFFHKRVVRMRKLLPQATTGILIACNPADAGVLLESARADNLHVNQRCLDAALVQDVRRAGKRIVAWGIVTEITVIDRLIALGVDAIGSDRPDLVLQRLRGKETAGTP
jgi:glycerophosphoryl diester phosphodiesterase